MNSVGSITCNLEENKKTISWKSSLDTKKDSGIPIGNLLKTAASLLEKTLLKGNPTCKEYVGFMTPKNSPYLRFMWKYEFENSFTEQNRQLQYIASKINIVVKNTSAGPMESKLN